MSVRSASSGSPAAKSIRLALRTSSIVETSSASFVRWALRCFGRRRLSSEPRLSAISLLPFIMWFRGPPKAEPLNHTPIPHVNSFPSKLIDGKTLGVMTGASLGVAVIGKSLAQARGLLPKHAVKQVDRLLSNPRIEAWDVFARWVPGMVRPRTDIVVALDWTDFDVDGQATLALKPVTRQGRATSLIWL